MSNELGISAHGGKRLGITRLLEVAVVVVVGAMPNIGTVPPAATSGTIGVIPVQFRRLNVAFVDVDGLAARAGKALGSGGGDAFIWNAGSVAVALATFDRRVNFENCFSKRVGPIIAKAFPLDAP